MSSPVDSNRVGTNGTSAATSHPINVGSPAAGKLLIIFCRYGGNPGVTTFTGYTRFGVDSSDASDDVTEVYYRWTDGNEGATDTLTTANSIKMGAICWIISDAANPNDNPPEISTVATGGTTANTCNPASISPTGGSKDYLFLALGGQDGETGSYSGVPSGYANLITAGSGTSGQASTNVLMGGGSLQKTGSSEDPGVFTHNAANSAWTAFTVAVYPQSPPVSTQEEFFAFL